VGHEELTGGSTRCGARCRLGLILLLAGRHEASSSLAAGDGCGCTAIATSRARNAAAIGLSHHTVVLRFEVGVLPLCTLGFLLPEPLGGLLTLGLTLCEDGLSLKLHADTIGLEGSLSLCLLLLLASSHGLSVAALFFALIGPVAVTDIVELLDGLILGSASADEGGSLVESLHNLGLFKIALLTSRDHSGIWEVVLVKECLHLLLVTREETLDVGRNTITAPGDQNELPGLGHLLPEIREHKLTITDKLSNLRNVTIASVNNL